MIYIIFPNVNTKMYMVWCERGLFVCWWNYHHCFNFLS